MAACVAFQTWEFIGSHDEPARARSLFKSVRAGWVKVGGVDDTEDGDGRKGK